MVKVLSEPVVNQSETISNSRRGKRGRTKSDNEAEDMLKNVAVPTTENETEITNLRVSPQKKGRKGRKVEAPPKNCLTQGATDNVLLPLPQDSSDRRGTFVVSDKENEAPSPEKPQKRGRGRRIKSKELNTEPITEIPVDSSSSPGSRDRRGSFVVSHEMNEVPPVVNRSSPEKPAKRGRAKKFKGQEVTSEIIMENPKKNISSPDSSDRRGSFVVSDKENEAPSEGNINSPEKPNKRGRAKRLKSKELNTEPITEIPAKSSSSPGKVLPEPELKSNSKRGKRGRTKSGNESSPEDMSKSVDLPTPENETENSNLRVSPQKKGRKGRKVEAPSKNDLTQETTGNAILPLPQDCNDRRGTFVVSDKKNEVSSQESCSSPEKPNKRGRAKRLKSKELNTELIPEIPSKSSSSPGSRDRRGSFVVSHEMNEVPPVESHNSPEKPTKRGRAKKLKSQEVTSEVIMEIPKNTTSSLDSSDRRGSFVVSDKENDAPSEETIRSPEKPNKRGRAKRLKSKELNTEPITEVPIMSSSSPDPVESGAEPQVLPQKKSRKGRKVEANVMLSDETSHKVSLPLDSSNRRGTFVVSEKMIEVPAQVSSSSPAKSNKRGQTKKLEVKKDEKMDTEEAIPEIPEKSIPSSIGGNRRDTFVVSEKVDAMPVLNKSISTDKIKKKNTTFSIASPKASKKIGIAVAMAKKNVNFITPEASRLRTPKKSNVTLTPHPIKKSISTPLPKKLISTPLSVKKTPGQFSAKKMPNFAKIHKKNFEKMENLVSYSERKMAKLELFSPLNKTFTGLSTKEKVVNKLRSSLGRKPAKSLIPVRSGLIRLEDTEKLNSFAQKKHVVNIEKIREKERNLIKGVRANKRFMLQMQMRKLAP